MHSHFVFLFVFCFTSAAANIVGGADILNLSEQLLEIQDDVITITRSIANGDNLDSVKSRYNATREAFEILASNLSENNSVSDECDESVTALLEKHFATVKTQMKELQKRYEKFERKQLVSEAIEDIKALRFISAQEKLEDKQNYSLIVSLVQDFYTNSSSFEMLTNLTENLTNPDLVYYFVKALKQEMSINSTTGDPYKWMRLAKVIEAGVINKLDVDSETKSSSLAIVDELYESIKIFTLNALKSAAGGFEQNGHLDNLTAAVYNFDPEYSENIVEEFVHSTFEDKYEDEIFHIINSHRFIRQRIKGFSAFYWRLKGAYKGRNDVVLNIASALFKIHSDTEFKLLSRSLQQAANNVINALPTCARNLFFLPSVCLWNKANEEYLTAGNSTYKNDGIRRNIFSTENSLPSSRWKVEHIDNKFLFSSVSYPNEYLYSAEYKYNFNMRYVFSWIPGNNTDRQSTWFIRLWFDGYCFVQSAAHYEHLISTNYKKLKGEDRDLNYAFIWIPRTSIAGNEFQWQIRECE